MQRDLQSAVVEPRSEPASRLPKTDSPGNPYLETDLEPLTGELDIWDLTVEGTLPAELCGVFLRNGPNPAKFAPDRYHVLDGDGMVHGVWLSNGRATRYCNRWVRTDGFVKEQQAGRPLFGSLMDPGLVASALRKCVRQPRDFVALLGSVVRPAGMLEAVFRLLGIKHVANTSVIRHAGRVLALWECGTPYELDENLETVGKVDFAQAQPNAFFSAHPKIDPKSGEMHTFGMGIFPRPYFHYYAYDQFGRLTANAKVSLAYAALIHDFAVTAQHIIILNTPLKFALMDHPIQGDGFQWRPDLKREIVVIDRAKLVHVPLGGNAESAVVFRGSADAKFVFHIGAACTHGDIVSFDACAYDAPPMLLGRRGDPSANEFELARYELFRIDLSAKTLTVERPLGEHGFEFPMVDDHYRTLDSRYTFLSRAGKRRHGAGYVFDTLLRFDRRSGESREYRFEAEHLYEGVFVPASGVHEEGQGWLLCTSWVPGANVGYLNVLDASELPSGPVARVRLPQRIPMGLHATWLPARSCRPGCPVCSVEPHHDVPPHGPEAPARPGGLAAEIRER